MSVATVVAVGAVAAGAAAVAKSHAANASAKRAAGEQARALDGLEYIDIDQMSDDALAGDRKRFEEQFKLQKDVDPALADVREQGAKGILDGLKPDAGTNDLLRQLTQEGQTDSPKRQAIIDQLISSAQGELNAGATLPPEFQAELIRSGLEKTGSAGTTGSGADGVQARTLLGNAGIQLQAFRRSQATDLLSTADQLKQNRAAILANTLGTLENAKNAQAGRATNAYQIGASSVPSAGLTGADVVNLELANTNQKNAATLGKGNIYANLALAKGAAQQQMIGGLTSAFTGAIGGIGGGNGGIISNFGGAGNGFGTPQYAPTTPQTNAYGYTRGGYLTALA